MTDKYGIGFAIDITLMVIFSVMAISIGTMGYTALDKHNSRMIQLEHNRNYEDIVGLALAEKLTIYDMHNLVVDYKSEYNFRIQEVRAGAMETILDTEHLTSNIVLSSTTREKLFNGTLEIANRQIIYYPGDEEIQRIVFTVESEE